jgi:hypothetical protein
MADAQRLFDLGMMDRSQFSREKKSADPDGWINRLVQELESRHSAEPEAWGKPSVHTSPYRTIEFTLNSDIVNMPEYHYNDYAYRLVWDEPIQAVIYLEGDSWLELRASYANPDFEEDEDDSYDATWVYDGEISIFTVEDILTIVDEFNTQVDDDTIEDSEEWRHD